MTINSSSFLPRPPIPSGRNRGRAAPVAAPVPDPDTMEVVANVGSVERRARQMFRQAVASLLETDQAAFRIQSPAGRPVQINEVNRNNLLHALQIILDQAASEPPLIPENPNYLGILSCPPSPGVPLTSYDVWRSTGVENAFTLFKVMAGPVLDHAQRSLYRKDPTIAARMPENVNRWYENFGRFIHCAHDGPDECDTDFELSDEDGDPDMSNGVNDYVPAHKIVKAEEVKIEADPWISSSAEDEEQADEKKVVIKHEDQPELSEYVEQDFTVPIKYEDTVEQE